jgi:membrane-associated phospholipid phosphatase
MLTNIIQFAGFAPQFSYLNIMTSTDRLYRILLAALIVSLPIAFIYNDALFVLLNCSPSSAWLDWTFLILTSLADGLWTVMLAAVFQSYYKRDLRTFVWALIIGSAILHLTKYLVDAPRPLRALGAKAVCVLGQPLSARSFPSGHSFSAALFFMYMRPQKSVVKALLLTVITTLAIVSRAYVGAHFPRDMVTGALIAVIAYWIAEKWPLTRRLVPTAGFPSKLGLTTLGAGAAIIYIFFYPEKTPDLTDILTPAAYGILGYWIIYIGVNAIQALKRRPGGSAK